MTEKTRRLVSPSQEKELQMTNSNLAEELQKSKYQASHLEQTSKKLREEKLSAEKERDHVVEQNKSLSITIEVFHRLPLLLPFFLGIHSSSTISLQRKHQLCLSLFMLRSTISKDTFFLVYWLSII